MTFNKTIRGYKGKNESSKNIEENAFRQDELKSISNFINSVCRHKTEQDNLHVHNHHLRIEFVDFGAVPETIQINLDSQDWKGIDMNCSILMPSLDYFLGVVVKIHDKIFSFINDEKDYKEKVFELYDDKWGAAS